MKLCMHSQHAVYSGYANCLECGALLHSPDNSPILKDEEYNGRTEVATSQLYLNIIKKDKVCAVYELPNRRELVDWLKHLTNRLHISRSTLHIAVAYMNSIMLHKERHRHNPHQLVLACLTLAAKYNEVDRNLPSWREFVRAAAAKLPTCCRSELKQSEAEVLRLLAWNLHVDTPLTAAELLLTQGVLTASDKINSTDSVSLQTARDITRETLNYIDLALSGTLAGHNRQRATQTQAVHSCRELRAGQQGKAQSCARVVAALGTHQRAGVRRGQGVLRGCEGAGSAEQGVGEQ